MENVVRTRNNGELIKLESKIEPSELERETKETQIRIEKRLRTVLKANSNVSRFNCQKAEMMAFKVFREEYEDYLDAILGDDRLLMKHKIDRIGKKYCMKSIIKSALEKRNNKEEMFDDRRDSMLDIDDSVLEILKDKLMIELIENPKKLWKHLSVTVRNVWISRSILSMRIMNLLKTQAYVLIDDEFRRVLKSIIEKHEFRGQYWYILKSFITNDMPSARNIQQFSRLFKLSVKNAFKAYFFNVFITEFNSQQNKTNSNGKGASDTTNKKRTRLKKFDDF